jgi:hypothetical protein
LIRHGGGLNGRRFLFFLWQDLRSAPMGAHA